MSEDTAIKSSLGALWIQPEGPNTKPEYVGCVNVADIEDPQGEVELIQCFDPNGGWQVRGRTYAAPGAVTTSVEQLVEETRSWMEKLRGNFTAFVMSRMGGRPDLFSNFVRARIIQGATVTSITDTGPVSRLEDAELTMNFAITGNPPLIRTGQLVGDALNTVEVEDALCVWVRKLPILQNAISVTDYPGKYAKWGSEAAVAASGTVTSTVDGGATLATGAVDPFIVGIVNGLMAGADFYVAKNTVRTLVVQHGVAGAVQGRYNYSDDGGATWAGGTATGFALGGAAAGHGAFGPNALFVLDMYHIWLVSAAGYIYFSQDGGATFTVQDAGVTTANDLVAVWFLNEFEGMAVSDTDDVLVTHDGGNTWGLATATGAGGQLNSVCCAGDPIWWVGTANGRMYFSSDFGETWTRRTGFPQPTVITNIKDIKFANSLVGFAACNTAVPIGYVLRTIDGGYTWDVCTYKTNQGLTQIAVADHNFIYLSGLHNGAPLAFMGRYQLP